MLPFPCLCARASRHRTRRTRFIFIVRGWGVLFHDGTRDRFESGDLLFVTAGTEHQIEEISENFAMWRVFYGPNGGEVRE